MWTLECHVKIHMLASVSAQGWPICPEAGVLAPAQALIPGLSKACMDLKGDQNEQQGPSTPAAWGPFPGHVRNGSDAPATCKAVHGETWGWGGGCS